MDDLLDSARSRLWDIVSTLARLEPAPELRVGLLTYGSPSGSSAEDGWVVRRAELTSDLDTVYGELAALTTDGGDELVGRVLHEAVHAMDWAPDADGLRLVFVAGNESADQGVESHDFRAAAEDARRHDVLVNALFAGNREQAVTEKWDELARRGGGTFSSIDVVLGTLQVATPQDALLLELNEQLNATYLPYGSDGAAGLANQVAQDANATRLGVQSCSSRVVAKGTALYTNASWDLVDAALQEDFQWEALRDDDLPEALRPLTQAQREERVARLRAEREAIQERIQEASAAREEFLRAERARRLGDVPGLDDAMRTALLEQAGGKGFRCGGC
jgi:hypothetical protein